MAIYMFLALLYFSDFHASRGRHNVMVESDAGTSTGASCALISDLDVIFF